MPSKDEDMTGKVLTFTYVVISVVGLTSGALVAYAFPAGAAELGGLYAEKHTAVDGISVRRVRDTEEGVVCYVAVGVVPPGRPDMVGGQSAAISCLRAR